MHHSTTEKNLYQIQILINLFLNSKCNLELLNKKSIISYKNKQTS